jgi:hypothetical protein
MNIGHRLGFLDSVKLETDVMIIQKILKKNLAKKWLFCSKQSKIMQKLDHNIGF